jgi:hypothetical protein
MERFGSKAWRWRSLDTPAIASGVQIHQSLERLCENSILSQMTVSRTDRARNIIQIENDLNELNTAATCKFVSTGLPEI